MKTIIAATDFSDIARNAVNYAADMAVALNAKLILYHAVETTVATTEPPVIAIGEYYEDGAFAQLEKVKEELITYTDHTIDIHIKLRWGHAGAEMDQLCYEEQPFAIVMATTKKSSFERILTGSRTLHISHRCHTPLLLVPEGASFKGFATIAIATDFEEVVDSMPLQEMTHWIRNFPAKLHIVNVSPAGGMKGRSMAEAVAMETHFHEFIPRFKYVTNNDAAEGIYQYVKENQPDLLIVVPKKRGWFYKSLSRQLILHPASPLLVMPKHLKDCNCG